MTTVAYRDGVIAADTLMSASGVRCGHFAKVERQGSLVIGFAGRMGNYEAFRSWVAAGAIGEFRSEGGNVFIIPPTGPAVVWGDGDRPWREAAEFWALGSGEHIALGAMAAGASAADAVRLAIEYDTSSGGEVIALARTPQSVPPKA